MLSRSIAFQALWDNYCARWGTVEGKGEISAEVAFFIGTFFIPGGEGADVAKIGAKAEMGFAKKPAGKIIGKITGFTKHGIDSAIFHDAVGVSESAMLDAVKNPLTVAYQGGGKTLYSGKNAVVVLNREGKVITTWAKSQLGWRIK